jgi:hypothetical protein
MPFIHSFTPMISLLNDQLIMYDRVLDLKPPFCYVLTQVPYSVTEHMECPYIHAL